MFILRTAFWLSLAVLILPTDVRQQEVLTEKVVNTYRHISTFCDRNERSCETGARYWGVFRQKADYGFQLVVKLVSEQLSGDSAEATYPNGRSVNGHNADGRSTNNYAKDNSRRYARPARGPAINSLHRADRAPAWRGTSAQDRL